MTEYIAIEDDNVIFSLFASFVNWIKVSLPNNAMVWLQRLSHLMPGDHFFCGNLNDNVLATYPSDLEDHSGIFDMSNGCLGNYLAMVRQDMHAGHAPSLSALCRNQWWICWRCGCIKGPWQKIILPIITKAKVDNFFSFFFNMFYWINKVMICTNSKSW